MNADHIKQAVQQFGNGDLISYAHLQPNLRRLETSFGLWSYRKVAGMTITLGGPLCHRSDRQRMLEVLLQKTKRPILFYLQEDFLPHLEDTSLFCTGVGVDRIPQISILLNNPSKKIRGARKKARKAGITWEEQRIPIDDKTQQIISDISTTYLQHAQCTKEMSFINMPLICHDASQRRLFLLRAHNVILGFAYLNPIYQEGRCISYLLDMLRFRPNKVWGLWLSTVYTIAQQLDREGFSLGLGFCPLYALKKSSVNPSRVLNAQMSAMSRSFSSAQYLTRLRELKEEIPGYNTPRYLASYTRMAPMTLYAFTEAMGVGIQTLWGPDLFRVLYLGWGIRRAR